MNKLINRYPGVTLAVLFSFVACGESLIELFFTFVGI